MTQNYNRTRHLHKVVVINAETRERYNTSRHHLKSYKNIWFHDDLIIRLEILAKQIREMEKGGDLLPLLMSHYCKCIATSNDR